MARKRILVLGSLRDASSKSGVSIGTWQRLERGDNVDYSSLVRIVDSLGWPAAGADWLLDGVDPDERGVVVEPEPEEPETDYNSRIARMPEHVRRTIDELIDGFERRTGAGG